MNDKTAPSRTSYAYQHRADLPGERSNIDRVNGSAASFDPARDPVRARALADQGKSEAERRGSAMVKSDRPHPAPRPSPHLALGPDRAAFNARWQREVRSSEPQTEDPQRAARREAFKEKRRKEQRRGRQRSVKHTNTR